MQWHVSVAAANGREDVTDAAQSASAPCTAFPRLPLVFPRAQLRYRIAKSRSTPCASSRTMTSFHAPLGLPNPCGPWSPTSILHVRERTASHHSPELTASTP